MPFLIKIFRTFLRDTLLSRWGKSVPRRSRSRQLRGIVGTIQLIRPSCRCFPMIPMELPRNAGDLLGTSSRAIAHLRAQLHRKRLGLVFGSGASKGLGFPDWKGLVKKV